MWLGAGSVEMAQQIENLKSPGQIPSTSVAAGQAGMAAHVKQPAEEAEAGDPRGKESRLDLLTQ